MDYSCFCKQSSLALLSKIAKEPASHFSERVLFRVGGCAHVRVNLLLNSLNAWVPFFKGTTAFCSNILFAQSGRKPAGRSPSECETHYQGSSQRQSPLRKKWFEKCRNRRGGMTANKLTSASLFLWKAKPLDSGTSERGVMFWMKCCREFGRNLRGATGEGRAVSQGGSSVRWPICPACP